MTEWRPLCVEPAAEDDIFCAECRRGTDAMSMVVTDPVERLLSEHQHMCGLSSMDSTMCMCTERFEGGPGYHRRHVATLIREALGHDPPAAWIPASEYEGR